MNTNLTSSTRRYDLDWLRVLLILTVFVFHSLRFFDQEGWTVKNDTTYMGVQIVIIFISRWMMPAIFAISGAATFWALGKRGSSPLSFLRDRSLRLLVPLGVGLFTHIPVQSYLWARNHATFSGSFWQFYAGMFRPGGSFSWMGAHLWYLEALFAFSLVCLPLLVWLRNGAGRPVLAWLGDKLASPAVLYLLILPVYVLTITLNPESTNLLASDQFGGWSLPTHLIFFLFGFVLASSQRAQGTILRLRWISLAIGLAAFLAVGVLFFIFGDQPFGTPLYALVIACLDLVCWGFLLAIFGFGMARLNIHTPLLDYASEAVLPFYIFHQTVLFVIGNVVLRWAVPDLARWGITFAISLATILALYEFLVRRINLLRVLFGLKPARKEIPARRPAVEPLKS